LNKKTVYIRRTEVALKQEESKAGASDIRSCKKPKLSEEEAIHALQIELNRKG